MIMSSTESSTTQFEVRAEPLVRYVEVWIPNNDATKLRLVSAQSVDHKVRHDLLVQVAELASGEGLAGKAWQQKSVAVVQQLDGDQLAAVNARSEADLAAVVAVPVFCQQEIRGVVLLGLGAGFGAAEVWDRDERDELAVSAAHYSGLESFEFISRYTRFPNGAGVPGRVWQTGLPDLLQNLGHSDSFIRSFGNDEAQISAAIGLPIGHTRGFPASVLLLLSSSVTPLSSLIELWDCEPLQTQANEAPAVRLVSLSNVGETGVRFDSEVRPEAWRSALLQLTAVAGQPILVTADNAKLPAGASFSLLIPVFRSDVLRSVLNLMF